MMIGFVVSMEGPKQAKNSQQILACIDEGMSLLGESGMKAVYWQMEKNFGLKHEEIPIRPEDFTSTLDMLFGSGAAVIRKMIVSEIAKRFEPACTAGSLEEAVRAAER